MRLVRAFSSSVNSAEVAFFSRLSSQWWNEQGEFSFLHKMNPVRMRFIRDKVVEIARDESDSSIPNDASSLRGLDVLDVGCGGGLLSESLARLGARTFGIDASGSNIAIAKHHATLDPNLSQNLSYASCSAESLLDQPQRYDIVCSMEVLEHVDNPSEFLKTCAKLLKPSGHLFVSTISRTPLAYFLTILMAEKVLQKVSPGTHTYSKFVKPSELIDFFRQYRSSPNSSPWISSAFPPTRTEAEVRGLIFNPLTSSWVLGPRQGGPWTTDCNYVFWVRKPKADDIPS